MPIVYRIAGGTADGSSEFAKQVIEEDRIIGCTLFDVPMRGYVTVMNSGAAHYTNGGTYLALYINLVAAHFRRQPALVYDLQPVQPDIEQRVVRHLYHTDQTRLVAHLATGERYAEDTAALLNRALASSLQRFVKVDLSEQAVLLAELYDQLRIENFDAATADSL